MEALLASGVAVDGVIVCTPHATHYAVGQQLLAAGTIAHVLMEKPFTTDVDEAKALHELVATAAAGGGGRLKSFQVNHSANWRTQTMQAAAAVREGRLGSVQHVTCFMGSPLACIFDEPSCRNWNEPTGKMVGNGFGWGQMSHIFAWVYQVTGLEPESVSCSMTYSDKTGADVYDAGVVTCRDGATIAFSGVACLPGDAHSATPAGKIIDCKVFGSEGALLYGGDDRDPSSGRLELRRNDGNVVFEGGFQFEDCGESGAGPQSVRAFVDACRGQGFRVPAAVGGAGAEGAAGGAAEGGAAAAALEYDGASSAVGLKTVQTIDAMYRSAKSGAPERVVV